MKQVIKRIMLLGCFSAMLITAALTARGGVLTFSNTNLITINDSTNPPTIASLYPSSLTVTGLTSQLITKVTVTIKGLTHSAASDVNILLVGPAGQKGILMSEVGGNPQVLGANNVTLILDDDATSPLPIDSALTTGTFKPTAASLPLTYDFPLPAPIPNSNSVCALSMFKNSDPSGTWKLYVVDDAGGDSGIIANGWSLNISFVSPQLAIAPVPPNYQLSWPATAQNYLLQSTSNILDPNSWLVLTNAQAVVSNRFVVSVPLSTVGNKFFRLIHN